MTTTLTDILPPELMRRLDALDVISRKMLQGKLQGERRSKRRGQSVEFAEHRPYVAGDDLRFIDWNIYARLDRLFCKLFLEDLDLTVHVMLDVSASSGFGDPPKIRLMKQLAAALGYVALVNNNRATLTAYADGPVARAAELRGRSRVQRMVKLLGEVAPDGASNFTKTCRHAAASGPPGVAIVISDFLYKEGYAEGLRALIGRGFDLYALQVLSPQEIDPPLEGDLRLLDVEDGERTEITLNAELMRLYRRNLAEWCAELERFCTRRGAVCLRTRSDEPVEKLVLRQLRRRGLLG